MNWSTLDDIHNTQAPKTLFYSEDAVTLLHLVSFKEKLTEKDLFNI
jgi:hypothetical protein